MKYAKRAAAFLLLASAAATGIQPVASYTNGYDCYRAGPPHLEPTVAGCVISCKMTCPQWYADCAAACAGWVPPETMLDAISSAHAEVLRNGDIDTAVRIFELAAHHPDERVRIVAVAVGAETPFVNLH